MKILVSPTKTMDPQGFDPGQLAFTNKNLKILSGLYGVLRPMDGIKPHHLDFNTPLRINSKGLNKFWQEKIITYFEEQTRKDNSKKTNPDKGHKKNHPGRV